uniref:Uncharacterized protein n=1 Tax=Chenopodium quinoa TaxID=63459 RepID=A0A803N8U7_CHEQI
MSGAEAFVVVIEYKLATAASAGGWSDAVIFFEIVHGGGLDERTVERRDKKDDLRESSRKRHRSTSRSGSPPLRGSNRETEDADRDYRAKDRSKSQDSDSERIKNRKDLEKSVAVFGAWSSPAAASHLDK